MSSFIISFDTSLPRVVGHLVLFLCLSFAVPSTMGSPSTNRSPLDSNKEGIQSIALSELFRITRITLHAFESSLNGL